MRSRAEKVAFCAIFVALGLVLSYVEAILPISLIVPIPGIKLGLANLAVMLAFFTLGLSYAYTVSLTRIALSALLFGSVTSLWFSLAGGLLSLLTVTLYRFALKRSCGMVGLSVLCAAMHNVGQCLACAALFGHYVLYFYLPLLLAVSVVTGAITGLITHKILNTKALTKGISL